MMKRNIVGAAGILFALTWTQSTLAQPTCADLNFTGPIAREHPQVRDACLDVVEREGRPFAHAQARIRSVRGGTVEAELRLPDGTYTEPITVTPDPSARVRIGGRNYRWRDLSRGQELDVWIPPDRFELAVPEDPEQQFAAAPAIAVFVISEPTTTLAANTLPRTASPVPLVGALGALLAALGFGVAAIRRRSS